MLQCTNAIVSVENAISQLSVKRCNTRMLTDSQPVSEVEIFCRVTEAGTPPPSPSCTLFIKQSRLVVVTFLCNFIFHVGSNINCV